jgi:hypothetical protein
MLDNFIALWLPIVVSAVAVWVLSAVFWMLINHHDGDYAALPKDGEIDLVTKLRSLGVQPRVYLFPHVANCNDDKKVQQQKFVEGPCGTLTVFPKPDGAQMGRNMVLSVLLYLAVSIVMAYLGSLALPVHAKENAPSFAKVFQFMGTAGVLGYAFAHVPGAVWFGATKRAIVLNILDGVVYGLAAGAVFAWLWPR